MEPTEQMLNVKDNTPIKLQNQENILSNALGSMLWFQSYEGSMLREFNDLWVQSYWVQSPGFNAPGFNANAAGCQHL
jgi:hypothetical protein